MVKNREHQGSVSHRSTVWILEDDADIGYVLDYFLTEQGFQIRLFSSAESFRDSLASGLPDLFLMDVMLPDGDGVELCRELKQNPRCSKSSGADDVSACRAVQCEGMRTGRIYSQALQSRSCAAMYPGIIELKWLDSN